MTTPPLKSSAGGIRGSARRTLGGSVTELVDATPLDPRRPMPLLVSPRTHGVRLPELVARERDWFDAMMLEHGAIVFSGFGVGVDDFEEFMRVTGDGTLLTDPARYDLGGPKEQVYITTRHPKQHDIYMHNETWWQFTWARKIYFCCDIPPGSGGATTISDCRAVYERLDPAILAEFADGILHVRNFGARVGLRRWQEVFGTEDREEVERFCREREVTCHWRGADDLQTRHVRPAVLTHPETGDRLWFNHGAHLHMSTNTTSEMAESLAGLGIDDVPANTYHVDGSPIPDATMAAVRAAYDAETVVHPWEPGNLMVVDNMRCAHGRQAFTGERKILAGMTELLGWNTL